MEGTALRLARVEDLDRVQELEELGTFKGEGEKVDLGPAVT